jgi:hypothetical protein
MTLMQRAKRLFPHTFKAVPSAAWCIFRQPAKRQFSGRVEKATSRPRRSAYRVPPSGRAVSLDFFDLLKRCVDSDQDLRFVNGEMDLTYFTSELATQASWPLSAILRVSINNRL